MIEPVLTTGDIAARFRISRSTLCRYRQIGTGPKYHKVGRCARYFLRDVEAWIAGNTTEPSTGKVVI